MMASSFFRISRLLRRSSVSSHVLIGTTTLTITGVSLFYSSKTSLEDNNSLQKNDNDTPLFQLEVDFMDKIASKPYLPETSTRKIPRRLRLLVIDVPQLSSSHIKGECRINSKLHYYENGIIAPPKHLKNNVDVQQKSLADCLIKCRSTSTKRIGVEILNTSIAKMNPHNLRKLHTFGNFYKYDPGKYASSSKSRKEVVVVQEQDKEKSSDNDDSTTNTTTSDESPSTTTSSTVLATEQDEEDAPWNQYAWIQELQLRIAGKVGFGEPMQPSSKVNRLLFGSVYKTTIPSCRSWWQALFILPMFQQNPAGQDLPGGKNWASNKPHAVVADGAAMQRVAGSLKFLQNLCDANDVPLFIINDERAWGAQTHFDLNQVLVDLRRQVKLSQIKKAMQGGNSFARGRMLGRAEMETKWQAKEVGRKTRQVIRETNEQLKREAENDWSSLDEEQLESKLVQHKVILKPTKQSSLPEYTSGMVKLSQTCVANEEKRQEQQATASSDDEKVKQASGENGAKAVAS